MAVAATIVWECRTTATAGNLNGGGFKPGASGVDYSQQDAAQYNLTSVTSAGAGNVILSASAATDMVGNIAHVISGTNFTAGWYEITAVSAGVSITLSTNAAGTSATTGVGASGVVNIGGAMPLNSTLDSEFFAGTTAGNTIWMKAGAYSLGETVAGMTAGTSTAPINIFGYNATRGDNPTGANRPSLNALTTFAISFGAFYYVKNLMCMATSATPFICGANDIVENCKFLNTSTTTARDALRLGQNCFIINTEAISYRGNAIDCLNNSGNMFNCYIHDSNIGVSIGTGPIVITDCVFSGCNTAAIGGTAATTGRSFIQSNTIFGATNNLGIGVSLFTGSTNVVLINNILSGLSTGVSHADAANVGYDDYNVYFNNTSNTSNWTLGPHSVTGVNPNFTLVAGANASTATTSGSVLTSVGSDFSAVIDGQDFVYLAAGTGITTGVYGITAHTTTTLTLDIAPGTSATADKVFKVTTGRNWNVGGTMANIGTPGTFNGGIPTVGYTDAGAVQRQNSGGGGSFGFA